MMPPRGYQRANYQRALRDRRQYIKAVKVVDVDIARFFASVMPTPKRIVQ